MAETESTTHHDLLVKIAVTESTLQYTRGELLEFKAESRGARQETHNKLDQVIEQVQTVHAQLQNLQGQRTIVAGIVATVVSVAVAVGTALVRKL